MLADYFDTLVPMVYYRMSSNLTIVNSFEITFKVVVSLDGNYSLVRASIIGTYESTVANGSASVTVSVNYMTFL